MIAETNYPGLWNSIMMGNLISTILYTAMFMLCVALAYKRPEPGFRLLVIATGIWVINIGLVWTMNPVLLRLTFWLFPIGQFVMVIGLFMLLRAFSGKKLASNFSSAHDAEQVAAPNP